MLVLLFDGIAAHGVFTAPPRPGSERNWGRKGRCGRGAAPPLAVFTPNKAQCPHLKSAGRWRGRRGPGRGGRAGTCCRWGSACPAAPGARPAPSPWPSRPRARTRAPGEVSAPSGTRPCRDPAGRAEGLGQTQIPAPSPPARPGAGRAGASIQHPGPGRRRSGGLGLMLLGTRAGQHAGEGTR